MVKIGEFRTIVRKAFELCDSDILGYFERNRIKKILIGNCAQRGALKAIGVQLDEVIKTVDDNHDGRFLFEGLFKFIKLIL